MIKRFLVIGLFFLLVVSSIGSLSFGYKLSEKNTIIENYNCYNYQETLDYNPIPNYEHNNIESEKTIADAGNQRVLKQKTIESYVPPNDVDMLIFVSPQYANDTEILQAIDNYTVAVKEDVNWSTQVIYIYPEFNDFKLIDNIIESYYENYSIKACIMIGEDTNTALSADTDYMELPSTVPWYTTGGESSYTMDETGIKYKTYQMDICISLIYPTSDQDYTTKKSQIISVFNKFSHRHVYYNEDILVFIDSKMAQGDNNKTRHIYQSMGDFGNLYYKEDPTESELLSSLAKSYSMYYVGGHSDPSGTNVNQPPDAAAFEAYYLDQLDTPFFGASGCYVGGWYSDFPYNNRLDPSITRDGIPHYGSMIFTAPVLRVMVLGELAQYGYSYPVSFIEHAVKNLTSGKTLAESMIGYIYFADDQTVVGDPTFHYSFENSPPSIPDIDGSTHGKAGISYTYYSSSTDSDGDQVFYNWSWGYGKYSGWIGPYEPGENTSVIHSWGKRGIYLIKVKAKDTNGVESDWSDPMIVSMPRNVSINSLLMKFLERFPNAFPILKYILGWR